MSDEPKGTDAIRAYRNPKAEPCLSMGLRTEAGVHELCDKHYDAGKTESIEHCAVCKLEAENKALRELIADALNDNHLSANMTKQPNPTDSYGINARKLWALKQAVEGGE